jgi:predicted AAA+ superfamily ATPase
MYERLLRPHLERGKKSVLVLGPRQVGKSTLLDSLRPELAINLSDPPTFRDYLANPEQLQRELSAKPRAATVLIDEVQRVPELLDAIQVILDRSRHGPRFLLSGSSARKLRRGHANLLPGRIVVHHLHPLVAAELGAAFDLERALAHGMLPGIWAEPDSRERASVLRSYSDSYLREEIQAEALVRNLGGYARLLDLVAASSGRILNLSALCRDAGLSFETARRYLEVLEDTLIVRRVPAWTGSLRSSLVAHPKLFLFDVGVRNALLRRPLDRCLPDERGLLLEHLVASELMARLGTIAPEMGLCHYRTRAGAEVDFVVTLGREIWGVEVKAARRIDRGDLSGLRSFSETVRGVKRRILVCQAPRAQEIDGVEILPFERFFDELPR